jgi:putative hydrolase of the HAD superfamily
MKIRHIFFDLDNTLWDHRKNAYLTLENLFERKNIQKKYHLEFQVFHQVFYDINEVLWAKIREGEIDKDYLRKHRFYDSFLHFGIDDWELSEYFESQFLDEIIVYNHLLEGCVELLDYLQSKNFSLHIISNGFQDVTHRKVEKSGISKYFQTITSADELNIRKPKPEIFQLALDKANANKSESLMVGDDWIADVEGAIAFGLDVVFFEVLQENNPTKGVKTITQLSGLKNIIVELN